MGDARTPVPDGHHGQITVDATGAMSWRDLGGSYLTVGSDIRWDTEWARHIRTIAVAGHRRQLHDAHHVEQALRWIREALTLAGENDRYAARLREKYAPPP